MAQGMFVQFSAFDGPSLLAPFPAVVAEVDAPARAAVPVERLRALFVEYLPESFLSLIKLSSDSIGPAEAVGYVELASALASALQDLGGPCGLPMAVQRPPQGHARILLGYHDVQTALHALRAGLEIARLLFARIGGGPDPRAAIAGIVERTAAVMALRQPDAITRALMRAAGRRDIPVYPVAPGSRVWQYGQGSASVLCYEAANEQDSGIGARLASDKFMTNQLIRRLGLPGVEHEVVRDIAGARRVAEQYGFPLVVKPMDAGKGRGVTAGIRTQEAFERAFTRAARDSRRGVLVERFVAGNDHRLAVFGGRLCWASRRAPPRVMGDGVHTVAELIDQENVRRSDADVAAGFVTRLLVDGDLIDTLAGQGLALGDRPEAGRVVVLRIIANTSTGGTVTDCTDLIHPDNRELAETLARAFRMDALGIDFMTPDISRSWREVPCAVLELNATPGFSSDPRADLIIDAKFPGGRTGRIPTVVLVDAEAADLSAYADALRGAGLRVGETDGRRTRIDGQSRCLGTEDLPARVTALLLDPACHALVIGATLAEIERHGFPLDRCDLAVVAPGCEPTDALRRLIDRCARETRFCGSDEALPRLSPTQIAALGSVGTFEAHA